METTFLGRLKHAWNAFVDRDQNIARNISQFTIGSRSSYGSRSRPDMITPRYLIERTVIDAIYNRISVDVSSIDIRHVQNDADGRYESDRQSYLNECLTVEANIDQAARAFKQDAALTLLREGYLAIVPIDTTSDPESSSFDIITMRIGTIKEWQPYTVIVNVWNEAVGERQEIELEKRSLAIVFNPFYSIMNEPNSTLQRLNHKLALLDAVDEQSSSGKLDLIFQLPYVVKNDTRKSQAERRREDIELQLAGSKYGIAYIDGTERITQLNRPVENNLLAQVEYLTRMLYSQLGITDDIMNGTASPEAMQNYYNRTIEPIVDAVCEAMLRSFLTKTARTRGQSIRYFRDPFKLIPVTQVAEIADKFTRNEIASANEMRVVVGWKPSKDPKADELRNSNMPDPNAGKETEVKIEETVTEEPDNSPSKTPYERLMEE